ncbi:MAG: 1-acyl-sn-glycerol-3-phosphate acyltransferase [Flavobacteriaceae bacterium]|nr:1-acyl-sn-glycerol-3-phosphate acyltransferase [Flavobacteriaceae bacterium]
MFFYFRRINLRHLERIPKDKPVLLLSNHQNALLDALIIASQTNRFSYFLTRAAVFKKPLVAKLLNSVQMLPVYRIRDGWGNIANNNAIFESCTKLLHQGNAVAIFPEGSHNLARTVRPLSKGFTRIVFETLECFPETDLQLIPLGLNFARPTLYPDSVTMCVGQPISGKIFMSLSKNEATLKLKQEVQDRISQLTTDIPKANYQSDLAKLEALNVDFLNPEDVNTCIANNYKQCKTTRFQSNSFLTGFLKGLLILNLLPVYVMWKLVFYPKIKEPEFISTFRFGVAVTLVPIYLILMLVIFSVFTPILWGISYIILILLIALLAVKL